MSSNGTEYLCESLIQKDFKKKRTHYNQETNTFWLVHIHLYKKKKEFFSDSKAV